MIRIYSAMVFLIFISFSGKGQSNLALNMSEVLVYNTRFNPADMRQMEVLKNLKPSFLIKYLKTDDDKYAFWINVYNSYMLNLLRDTTNEGVYTNFYKKKNITIAAKTFSLFEIEHEFLRLGKKNKALGFKKSRLKKDTTWQKLVPLIYNEKSIMLMYRGLYGYPPFQLIESGNIDEAYRNSLTSYGLTKGSELPNETSYFDWVKLYLIKNKNITPQSPETIYYPTPIAVYIKNFYPKYEGPKFIEEEKNPWLK